MRSCIHLTQSFNRPNLRYEVHPKTKNTDTEIYSLITTHYPRQSGIIYCTSKKSCEEMSDKLRKMKVSATFYHAGLDKSDRSRIQKRWIEGEVQVIGKKTTCEKE